jgi:hypothetical protein
MRDHHSNVGLDASDLVATRIDWMNEAKQMVHDQTHKVLGSRRCLRRRSPAEAEGRISSAIKSLN